MTLVFAVPIVSATCTFVGTVERTSTSWVNELKPVEVTTMWYGLNGIFVKRKLPSVPVVVSRWKPLTAYVISTVAPAMEEPDGSFTMPSIDPEFPCEKPDDAKSNNPNARIEIRVQTDLPQCECR